jgi:nitrogen fixation protein FixH
MSTSYFWPGETVRVRVTFRDEAGDAVAVAGVAFAYRAPGASSSEAVAEGAIVQDGTGVYYTDLPLPTSGDWALRATCATPTTSAIEIGFSVLPSAVLP